MWVLLANFPFCSTERDPTLEIRYRHKKSKEKDREGERERAEKDELRAKAQELALEQSRSSKVSVLAVKGSRVQSHLCRAWHSNSRMLSVWVQNSGATAYSQQSLFDCFM